MNKLACALVAVTATLGCNFAADWCGALANLRDKEANCPSVLDGGPYLSDAGYIFVGCESVLTTDICTVPERTALAAAGSCLSALPTCVAGQESAYNAQVAACLASPDGGVPGDAGSPVPQLNATCAENLYGAGAL